MKLKVACSLEEKLWQSCCCCCQITSVVSESVWPHRRQPPSYTIPGILQGRTLEWVAISFSNAWKWKVKVKSLSHVRLLATLWTNVGSVIKSRDITLPTEIHISKAMFFPVVMYEWESWTIKKAEHQSTDAFELWCRRRFLRVSWIARRSNQSILKEINLEYSLEGLMMKLKPQCFVHLMQRTDSFPWCWERLRAGEGVIEDEIVRYHHWLNGHEFEKTPEDGRGQRSLACYSSWGLKESNTA